MKIFIIIFLFYLYMSYWLLGISAFFWGGLLLLAILLGRYVLDIDSKSKLKAELVGHLGAVTTSIAGAVVIPILIFLASNGNVYFSMFAMFIISPGAAVLGYLWFRLLDWIAFKIKKNLKSIWNQSRSK